MNDAFPANLYIEAPYDAAKKIRMGNFRLSEWACKGEGCCDHSVRIRYLLWWGAQLLRNIYRSPVIIVSGNRCPIHNTAVGGSPHSDHLIEFEEKQLACGEDIRVVGVPSTEVAKEMALLPTFKRIGVYEPGGVNGPDGFCHGGVIDRGPGTWRRWRANPDGEVFEYEIEGAIH